MVPARNEVDVIAEAVTTLLQQDYPGDFHVIVVDDHSTDGTADAARAAALQLQCPDRLTVLSAKPLPPGWSGKVWAQSQGIEAVRTLGLPADFLLLTDADIGHPADAVAQLVARADAEQRDLVSLMVRLRCDSFWEKALIPAFVFFFAKLYPFSWVNNPRNRTAAAAGGCMLVRRSALEEAGGIESIRAELIDDCSLAARIKHRGTGRHPIRLDVAARSVSLRPYDSWREIWNMIARTAFTQLHYSPLLLAGTLAGHDDHLSDAAGRRAGARTAGLARVARVGGHVLRVCADAQLLPPLAAVGAVSAADRVVLCRRDVCVGGALLARQGRSVEGARSGAGAGTLMR